MTITNFTLLGNYGSLYTRDCGVDSHEASLQDDSRTHLFCQSQPRGSHHGNRVGPEAVGGLQLRLFWAGTGLKFNAIPTAGSGAMGVAQTAGGHMDVCIVALGAAKAMIEGGQLRLLATLGEERLWAPYDKVPTIKELGYDMSYESPNFAMGPPNLPPAIVDILVKAVKKAVDTPEYKKYCVERAFRWNYLPPDKMIGMLDKQREIVRDIFAKAGVLKESK